MDEHSYMYLQLTLQHHNYVHMFVNNSPETNQSLSNIHDFVYCRFDLILPTTGVCDGWYSQYYNHFLQTVPKHQFTSDELRILLSLLDTKDHHIIHRTCMYLQLFETFMFKLTCHIFQVSLLNFTVLCKYYFTIGIHRHCRLFPAKLKVNKK